jgi:hypothetical protein
MNTGYPQIDSWVGWTPVFPQQRFAPGGAVTVVPWVNSAPALFTVDSNGTICTTSPAPPPTAPTNFQEKSLSPQPPGEPQSQITVVWTDDANDESDFVVQYTGTYTGTQPGIHKDDIGNYHPPGTLKMATFPLYKGYTYTLYVEAQNAAGGSSASNSITVPVPEDKTPSK